MLEELKPVVRWTRRRKAAVVWAIDRGLMTAQQACEVHRLTDEEIETWRKRLHRDGEDGLRALKVKEHREVSGTG